MELEAITWKQSQCKSKTASTVSFCAGKWPNASSSRLWTLAGSFFLVFSIPLICDLVAELKGDSATPARPESYGRLTSRIA